ncbi:hypothetical protein J7E78_01340 [Paenibacillus polymyxa]|uniref:hypothetical protein n=1 Tax=Paenibacillus polymyxa TaxID=1406 RepID=UPI001BE9F3F3|nr:hypothetical protein [Paenibacillus polymyxa]MBT2282196.1 hypothetical protein [Paenibacillus polymyxa]
MIKGTLGYILGIAFIGSTLAFALSMLLDVLLYAAVCVVILLPIWGSLRHSKNWTHEGVGLRKWLRVIMKVFKMGKPRLTFYLIASIVVGLSYEQIAVTAGYVVCGILLMLVLWESSRYALSKVKKVEIISFSNAMKSVW